MALTTLPTPRFYTALDPYFYEVDNRPLIDLAARDEMLVSGVNLANNAQFVLSAAAGFIARGYTAPNVAVGQVSYPGGFLFSVDRAFLTQETIISPQDQRLYPKIAISENPAQFTLSAPAVGSYRTFTVQAKVDFPDASLPFFDPTIAGSQLSTGVGKITWSIKQNLVDQTVFNALTYPLPDASNVEVIRITVPGGATQASPAQVEYINFKQEGFISSGQSQGNGGQYEYLHDQRVLTSPATTINGISVNTFYAFIFVDGAITFGVQRPTESTVIFDQVLPAGTVVDFITTIGGQIVSAEGAQDAQLFTSGSGGQSIFTGVEFITESVIVFSNGSYKVPTSYTIDSNAGTLTFTSPIPEGHQVAVLTLTGLPSAESTIPGGSPSQVLTKLSSTANDFDWRDPLFTFPGGLSGQILTKASSAPNDFTWSNASIGGGQCVLTSSGNNVVLRPFNGNLVIINGFPREVPLGGVSLNPAPLPAGIYDVYAYFDSQLRIEASANSPTSYTQAPSGVFVKTSEPTKTLVGFFYLETLGVLNNTADKRYLRSWFNESAVILSVPSQRDVPMAAFSPSQYKYIQGQILKFLSLPGDVVQYTSNCTVTTSQGETATVALARDKPLSTIPFLQADVDVSFNVSPSVQAKSSSAIGDIVSYNSVAVSYAALYGNENLSTGQVLLSSNFKGMVTRK